MSEQPPRASTCGPHLILIGPMGSGKTTVAHVLGRRLHRPVRDSDEELVAALGIDARTLLHREGRDALHLVERRVLAVALVASVPSVVAAAAGDVDDATSRAQMRHGGTVVYLRAPRDELVRRIGDGSTRPIDGSVEATLAATEAGREPCYTAVADVVVDAGGRDPEAVVDALLAGLARRIEVPLGERSYDVQIGPGVLREVSALIPASARRAAIVTQANIGIGIDPHLDAETFYIGDGESAKSMTTIETLCREFSRFGLTRADVVIAVGGGVVTDAAGFAAACYHRGTALLNVPTTLLGQIDAAVGGKTAVNIPEGKNLVGAFWQPCGVLCDTETLHSLPEREWRSGLGEMAKYAFLGVEDLDELPLVDQVARCLALKADVVGSDEREGGRRMILNYGHTLAHALEAAGFADGPGRGGIDLRHGEAVAIGLVFAARLAQLLGRIDESRVVRHRQLLETYDLPTEIPFGVDLDEMVFRMARDKKATAGIVFVLDGPHGVEPVRGVSADLIEAALAATSAAAPGPRDDEHRRRPMTNGGLVLVLSGPNLLLLGERQPAVYGHATLADHVARAEAAAARDGLVLEHFQADAESALVDAVHRARGRCDAIVLNAGALTHYGWSLHDALAAFSGPVVEVHLSNPDAREPWRHTSVLSPVVDGTIAGFGGLGYELAVHAAASLLAARADDRASGAAV